MSPLEQLTLYTGSTQFMLFSARFLSLYSAVTWKDISQCVQDSVSNVSHFPTVNNRIQR